MNRRLSYAHLRACLRSSTLLTKVSCCHIGCCHVCMPGHLLCLAGTGISSAFSTMLISRGGLA